MSYLHQKKKNIVTVISYQLKELGIYLCKKKRHLPLKKGIGHLCHHLVTRLMHHLQNATFFTRLKPLQR